MPGKERAADSEVQPRQGVVFHTKRRPASISCINGRHGECWKEFSFRDANYNVVESKCWCECHEAEVAA